MVLQLLNRQVTATTTTIVTVVKAQNLDIKRHLWPGCAHALKCPVGIR